jgi:N-acetylglucosamine kinase-like BadF-type ATPase
MASCAVHWVTVSNKCQKLIIGVDGGGTKTAVRIASVGHDGGIEILGEGYGGPSNVRAVGAAHAKTNLDVAIDAAHTSAGTVTATVDHAVLALAGSSLADVQEVIAEWAARRNLAEHVDIVHDAEAVLTVGVRRGCGIGLIVGTGSVAMGVNATGEQTVIGGWGHLFGDQGSGFDIGRRSLAAVADAVDGIGAETTLSDEITKWLQVDHPREIARKLSLAVDVRQEIAALAPFVVNAAINGDDVAEGIVDSGAAAAAALVAATASRLQLGSDAPLALAGGIACSGDFFRDKLLGQLKALGIEPNPMCIVADPVEGSLILARDRLLARETK